jgi:hypothetical protein
MKDFDLCSELLYNIFSFLSINDILCNIIYVNKNWSCIINSKMFWNLKFFIVTQKRNFEKISNCKTYIKESINYFIETSKTYLSKVEFDIIYKYACKVLKTNKNICFDFVFHMEYKDNDMKFYQIFCFILTMILYYNKYNIIFPKLYKLYKIPNIVKISKNKGFANGHDILKEKTSNLNIILYDANRISGLVLYKPFEDDYNNSNKTLINAFKILKKKKFLGSIIIIDYFFESRKQRKYQTLLQKNKTLYFTFNKTVSN